MTVYGFVVQLCLCTHFGSFGVQGSLYWDKVVQGLSAYKALAPLNLLIGDIENGLMANITLGDWISTENTLVYSASKMASGAVFWALGAEGVLALDSKLSDHLEWWPTDETDARSATTIRHLVNLTSGFNDDACIHQPATTYESCSKQILNTQFKASQQGVAVYNEAHLQLAQTVALTKTGAPDWSSLWYDKVGRPAGLPEDTYWTILSPEHAAGGYGMSIDTVTYSRFLSALHRSLSSTDQPTRPLAMGAGMDYGKKLFGGGMPTADGGHYAHTAWHRSLHHRSGGGPDSRPCSHRGGKASGDEPLVGART